MHRSYFLRHGLCDEQGEAPITTSGATVEASKPLTIGARLSAATAALTGKDNAIASIQSELTTAQTALTEAQAQVATLTLERDALAKENADLKSGLAEIETHVAQLEAAQKSADTLAKEKVAALGFPAGKLPAAVEGIQASTADQIADIRATIAKTSDPQKRGELVAQIEKLKQQTSLN